jgi:hypothetical protein
MCTQQCVLGKLSYRECIVHIHVVCSHFQMTGNANHGVSQFYTLSH